jgi:hypothetical protein
MARISVPGWAPLYFAMQGALIMLVLDRSLDQWLGAHATGLPLLALSLNALWYSRHRRQHGLEI